ncbi:MAG: hypothetical protein KatS3mg115_0827 [Candidatus Poribacteria bacterium]|nr:MAG: hypothetical protein KatS3mg115_0827 [Candidatus Poribacteria bacterium]
MIASALVAAFFDMDGTLFRSTILHHYALVATYRMPSWRRALWTGAFLPWVPYFWLLDRLDRGRMNRAFYRRYRGRGVGPARRAVREAWGSFWAPRLVGPSVRRLQEHQAAGHRTVLVTGSPEFVAQAVAERLEIGTVLAARLEEHGGRFTGRLLGSPLSGEAKAQAVWQLARQEGIDLSRSYAYGDSVADLAMLELVGHPVAVSPSRRLRKIAQVRGWPILEANGE